MGLGYDGAGREVSWLAAIKPLEGEFINSRKSLEDKSPEGGLM